MIKKSVSHSIHASIDGLLNLVFPEYCGACNKSLSKGEKVICISCRFKLPKTNYHLVADNTLVRLFWGKTKVNAATSYYHFGKGEKVQNLIHNLKYHQRTDIGQLIGELLAFQIMSTDLFSGIDIVIPVPLHESRLRQRGFNQCDSIADGLSKELGVPSGSGLLRRIAATTTQTKKQRHERHLNMEGVFQSKDVICLQGKHVLLVDDVITTGATLVACAEEILKSKGAQVSICAIACA
ncbi:MAG: ComF family protein [Bacteroidetes bacterium]|nr:MAG: ComF family protein [Bacteroidota bacterium]REK03365.1 MAG: ComF family protein [Bacteroidota bacterium]REK34524.1 MAG: ComF family protein [Bacteroidota bacterium]REK50358.1 MAG: ComF family protein [Bacteroidota bacterium]